MKTSCCKVISDILVIQADTLHVGGRGAGCWAMLPSHPDQVLMAVLEAIVTSSGHLNQPQHTLSSVNSTHRVVHIKSIVHLHIFITAIKPL